MKHLLTSKYLPLQVIVALSFLIITFVECYKEQLVYVDGSKCRRQCTTTRMNCAYNFSIETRWTMGKECFNWPSGTRNFSAQDCIIGAGYERSVEVVNRSLPGPSIDVCEGDMVKVQVCNLLHSAESTSIHWHGLKQETTPYMDGVPFITQCPILYKDCFVYEFPANSPGTHFWHSHVEVQRGDGVFGGLIVRQRKERNYHYMKYNWDLYEHTMIIFDWNAKPRMEVFQGYTKSNKFLEPDCILINGFGWQFNNSKPLPTNTPLANFNVQKGLVYRFRLINANFFDCPWQISIEKHKMNVISSDGEDVQEEQVDLLMTHAGERFDFLLKADQLVGTYWITVTGSLTCERLKTFQLATLRYSGSPDTYPRGPRPTYETATNTKGLLLNPFSRTTALQNGQQVKTIDQLRSVKPNEYNLDTPNPKRFFLSFDMSLINQPENHLYPYYGFNQVSTDYRTPTPQINGISFKSMDIPLMQNRHKISNSPQYFSQYCDADSVQSRNCDRNYCECTHALPVDLCEVVELIFVDKANQNYALAVHPVHLHGSGFRVLTWQEVGANLTRAAVIKNVTNYSRNFNNPPIKDTVMVPRGGVTIVRFLACNPGFWFLHCHIDVHSVEGMELVFIVGSDYEMSDPPPNFPQCGNYP